MGGLLTYVHFNGYSGTAMKPDRSDEMPRQADEPQASSAGQGDARQPVSSRELLGGHRELQIVHNGSIYRLRVTGNGKLILTK